METLLEISALTSFLSLFGLIALIFIIWRFASRHYQLPCPAWLAWLVERDNPLAKVTHAKNIVKNLYVKPGMRILDVGCGPGRVTLPLAHAVGPSGIVVAMDIQSEMLKKTEEKAQAAKLSNIVYLHAGIGEKKLEHNTYDRIVMVSVLGEIPNQKAALQEVFDALKPDGILSVTEIIFDPHFQRQRAVLDLVTSIGFRKKELFGHWYAYTMLLEKPA